MKPNPKCNTKLLPPENHLLQEWECIVEFVNEDTLECQLFDLTDRENAMELAEIWKSKMPEEIVKDACEGLAFYWQLGWERDVKGTIRNYSRFKLSR